MTARHDATPRQNHNANRRSTVQAGTSRVNAVQAGQRPASAQTQRTSRQGQPSRRPQAQNAIKTRAQQRNRRRPARRQSSIDTKVVAIVAVSLVIVLSVVGFFAHRRGLLDWTGIGMRKVAITVRADGFDKNATPIPVHIKGTRASGIAYERDIYISADQETFLLPEGTYTAEVVASPICQGGYLFSTPNNVSNITIVKRDVQVSGNSTGTLTLDLAHLDIIDATDEQVDAAIAAAEASAGKKSNDVVERNVPALQRLRQQSVLPDDLPETLVLESVMSGWSTTVTLLADGSFSGVYTQLVSSATGSDYPNGTAYTCTFSGKFNDVERLGTSGFRMTLGDITLEHEVGEKWVEDGILNVGSQALGFESGSTFELWRPSTPTGDFGWWLSAWCNDYASTGVPEELDRWALDNVDAGYGFFSEVPNAPAADEEDDADSSAQDYTEADSEADSTTAS